MPFRSAAVVALISLLVAAGAQAATVRLDVSIMEKPTTFSVLRQLIGIRRKFIRPDPGTKLVVASSAYSPSPYQTDSTPCLTAAGTRVREGTVASNFLPFGTLLEINGETYIVEDRMNPRYTSSVDIFFPSTSQAREFGRQKLDITVIGYGIPGQALPEDEDAADAREEGDNNTEEDDEESEDKEGFFSRVRLGLSQFRRFVSLNASRTAADINQYDVDCFREEGMPQSSLQHFAS